MARARKKMDHQKMVEAVAAGTKKYLRYDEAAELYSVGVNTIKKRMELLKSLFHLLQEKLSQSVKFQIQCLLKK